MRLHENENGKRLNSVFGSSGHLCRVFYVVSPLPENGYQPVSCVLIARYSFTRIKHPKARTSSDMWYVYL